MIPDEDEPVILTVNSGVAGVWILCSDGSEILYRFVGMGQTLGWQGVIAKNPPPVMIKCITDCVTCSFKFKQGVDTIDNVVGSGRDLAWFYTIQSFTTFYLTWVFAGKVLVDKVLRLLFVLSLIDSYGKKDSESMQRLSMQRPSEREHAWRDIGLSQSFIAEILRTNRTSVTRAIDLLSKRKIVQKKYRSISIDMAVVMILMEEAGFPKELIPPFRERSQDGEDPR